MISPWVKIKVGHSYAGMEGVDIISLLLRLHQRHGNERLPYEKGIERAFNDRLTY